MDLKWSLVFGLSVLLLIGLANSVLAEQDEKNNWWRNEVFYQIYPRSFKDSNGDGVGDLKGVASKLEYFVETGITAVWLSPIFQSPMVDFGYDISDYKNIQPEYGTLDDFDELLAKANKLGIKVILDFVPNHSSDQNEWFKKSAARETGYEDFYVWRDGQLDEQGERQPPNNWRSVFSGSAWEWHEDRQQFYLRQFTKAQPDLNYRNPAVLQAMDEVMLYWLNKGVAGFRIDAINYIYEDVELRDEPLSGITSDPNSFEYLDHSHTRDHPDNYLVIQHWRQLLDNYSKTNSVPVRIMMTEGYADLKLVVEFYENEQGVQGAQFPFNFDFVNKIDENSTAADFVFYIERWLIYMPPGHSANWVMGNHDNPRVASRFGVKSVDAMNMLLMTLPGIAITYYGEELGMADYREISWEDTVDKPACDAGSELYKWISRDPVRTAMQWSEEINAGFSTGNSTWLPVHPNYPELNLRAQQQANHSHYKLYQSLLKLRQMRVLKEGTYIAQPLNRRVFAFKRELRGEPGVLTIINVGNRSEQVDVSKFIDLPNRLTLLAVGVDSEHSVGERLIPDEVKLAPYEGLVIMIEARK